MASARPIRSVSLLAVLLPFSLTACALEGAGDAFSESDGGADGSLGAPNAVFPEDFGSVQTVRELADGTLLVADPLGGSLYHVDMDAGSRTPIGSEGQGPGEYRQPDAVWPLPGDSTLVVDLGNARLMTLGPTLEFGTTSPLSAGDPRTGMVMALPQAVDSEGFVYAQAMGGMRGGPPPDSGVVLRIERGSFALDSVARFKLQETRRTESGSGSERNVSISAVPLSPEDAWGVAPDGSIVVARSLDYHVEWFGPDGSMTAGDPVDFEVVSIGTAEKEEFVRTRAQSGGGIGISVSMEDGGAMTTSFQRGGGGNTREIDQYEWPETKPPFYDQRIVVDPRGRAWVRRHVEAGEDATYDLFDRSGAHVITYTIENNKRVIGFGPRSIYVVAYDEFDLNYLERYTLPGS